MSIDGYTDSDPSMGQVESADDMLMRLNDDLEHERLKNAELRHSLAAQSRQRRRFEALWRDERGRRREACESLTIAERRLRDARDENLRLLERIGKLSGE